MDRKKVDEFWASRTQISDARLATSFRDDDRILYDVALVEKYIGENTQMLDLGAGTCTLSQQFLESCRKIVVVDKFRAFLDKAPDHPKLTKVCADIVGFRTNETFDLILLFGIITYLSSEDEKRVYVACSEMLAKGGYLIVKNQCGLHHEVVVDSYSKEFSTHYHARYPSVETQEKWLSEFFDVERIDIYPPALNRWENTHFFAFQCRKK